METKKKTILYSSSQTPPRGPLFFSSLQHMLLVVSLGLALPVSVGRTVGLDLSQSTSLVSAALFAMGVTGILQTLPGRYIGSGYQSLSVSDSAALAACIMAAQIGGIPLVLGMTIFSTSLHIIFLVYACLSLCLNFPFLQGHQLYWISCSVVFSHYVISDSLQPLGL